ncbi:hypothetical protein ACZ90_69705 [Streptomyces albus subsp. albus]|nr:hypothetical protein ACZ90_69705 [Streptomyces albus subsp. albus]
MGPAAPGPQGVPRSVHRTPGVTVKSVKSLVKSADPVGGRTSAEPSRLPDGLAEMAGAHTLEPPPTGRAEPRSGRPVRRGVLLGGLALGAAAAVAAVAMAVHAPDGSPSPGGRAGGSGGVVADEPYYPASASLESSADVIVRARIGAGRQETEDGVDYTVAPARVLAIAKGKVAGRSVLVVHTTPGSGNPETAALDEGQEYVLLLRRNPDGRFGLVNTVQGTYRVEAGKAVPDEDNEVRLSARVLTALGLAG